MASFGNTSAPNPANRQHIRSGSLGLSKAIKRGWGVVHDQDAVRPWKRRMMVLHRDCFNFFDSDDDDQALHTIHVNDIYRISSVRTTPFPTFELRFRSSAASTSPAEKVSSDLLILHVRLLNDEHLRCWLKHISPLCPRIRGVSSPSDFVHRERIAFDWDTCSFINMPPEWVALLSRTKVKQADYAKDPQAILNYIEIYGYMIKVAKHSDYILRMEPPSLADVLERFYINRLQDILPERPPPVKPPKAFRRPNVTPRRLQPLRRAPPPPNRPPNQATLGRAAAQHVANPDHVSEVFIPAVYRELYCQPPKHI